MGRFADLCGTIAAEAEDGPSGLELSTESRDRLRRQNWLDSDIEDAFGVVRDSYFQSELVDAADSLSARLVDLLSGFAEQQAFDGVVAHGACLPLPVVAQLVRRVTRLEEILDVFREGSQVERRRFDDLRLRLEDHGIEDAMRR